MSSLVHLSLCLHWSISVISSLVHLRYVFTGPSLLCLHRSISAKVFTDPSSPASSMVHPTLKFPVQHSKLISSTIHPATVLSTVSPSFTSSAVCPTLFSVVQCSAGHLKGREEEGGQGQGRTNRSNLACYTAQPFCC